MSRKNIEKRNIMIFIAIILLCLVLLSTYFLSGLQAKFLTSYESNEGSHVAEFNVSESIYDGSIQISEFSISISPNESKNYVIKIKNDSEIKVKYEIKVLNKTQNIPLVLKLNNVTNDKISSSIIGEILPSNENNELIFNFSISWDETVVDNNFIYSGMVDYIVITINFEQID